MNCAEYQNHLEPVPVQGEITNTHINIRFLIGLCLALFYFHILWVTVRAYAHEDFSRLYQYGFLGGVVACVGGIVLLIAFAVLLRRKRLVEDIPTSKIGSAATGIVEIKGRARRKYDLLDPIFKTPCIYYSYREEYWWQQFFYPVTGGHRRGTFLWLGILNHLYCRKRSSRPVPFWIEDETGRITVDPAGAVFKVKKIREPNTEIIQDGKRIYVLGYARPVRRGNKTRDRYMEELRALKRDSERMTGYDLDKNGRIDEKEWEMARRDIKEKVLAKAPEAGSLPEEELVVGAPPNGGPFVIADSEEQLSKAVVPKIGFCLFMGLVGLGLGTVTVLLMGRNLHLW